MHGLHTISRLFEAMLMVTMRREDYHFVTQFLQADGCVNDQSFCPSYPKIRVRKDYSSRLRCFILGFRRRGGRHILTSVSAVHSTQEIDKQTRHTSSERVMKKSRD